MSTTLPKTTLVSVLLLLIYNDSRSILNKVNDISVYNKILRFFFWTKKSCN